MSELIVMRDSPEAAKLKTVTGWVSRTGHFYGDDERGARWSGCTHEICDGCGDVVARGWCRKCQKAKELEKWLKAERKEWDGNTPLYSDSQDRYFFNEDPREYANDEGLDIDDLQLYICDPVYGREIDDDFFADELPEDGEVPDVIGEAMTKLNEAIKEAGPLSWYAGKFVPILPPSVASPDLETKE